jgi:hypothetical protein
MSAAAVCDKAKLAHRYVSFRADPARIINWPYAGAAETAFDDTTLCTGHLGGEA